MTEASPPPTDDTDPELEFVAPAPIFGGHAGLALDVISTMMLLVLWGLLVMGRWDHTPSWAVIAGLTFLPWEFAAFVVWTFAVWSVVPDRRVPPTLMVAASLTALALWGPSWSAHRAQAEGDEIKMMTWNIRRLWGGVGDGGDPARCVIDAIRSENPDVLTLLEVSRNDLDVLESELTLSCAHATYRSGEGPSRGGLATCTRGDRWQLSNHWVQNYVDQEDWRYVVAEVASQKHTFNLIAVHLHPYRFRADPRGGLSQLAEMSRDGAEVMKAQGDQAAALLARVASLRDPTLVAGDFNSTRDTALHADLRGHLTDVWERGGFGFGPTVWFLDSIPLRIDYMYASDAFAVTGSNVQEVDCSDHRPVIGTLVLKAR